MQGKKINSFSLALIFLVIAAGQAINVAALGKDISLNIATTVLNKTSINITDFSIVVDGSVVDFF
jgi:hypothetical protein